MNELTWDDVVVEELDEAVVIRERIDEGRWSVVYVVRPESNPRLGITEPLYTRRGASHPLKGDPEEVKRIEKEIAYRALEHRLVEDGYIKRRDTAVSWHTECQPVLEVER